MRPPIRSRRRTRIPITPPGGYTRPAGGFCCSAGYLHIPRPTRTVPATRSGGDHRSWPRRDPGPRWRLAAAGALSSVPGPDYYATTQSIWAGWADAATPPGPFQPGEVSVPKQPEFAGCRDPRPVSSHIAHFCPQGRPQRGATRFGSMAHRACKNTCKNRYNGPSTRRSARSARRAKPQTRQSPAMSRAPDHGELLNHITDPGHAVRARYFGTLTKLHADRTRSHSDYLGDTPITRTEPPGQSRKPPSAAKHSHHHRIEPRSQNSRTRPFTVSDGKGSGFPGSELPAPKDR